MLQPEGQSVVLDRRETPRGDLALRQRIEAGAPVYEIIANGTFLMSSADSHSEERLAELGLEPLAGRDHMRLLVAGLGIGYTVASALACPRVLEVEVVEIELAVVEWARTVLATLTGQPLEDPRVTVVVRDIADHLSTARGPYDVILLDVDNGPGWLVHEGNAALYEPPALRRVHALLSDGGVLAAWSADRSERFLARLEEVFGTAEEIAIEFGRHPLGGPVFVYRARRAPGRSRSTEGLSGNRAEEGVRRRRDGTPHQLCRR